VLNEEGEKTLLTRQESLEKIKSATLVVEGANLMRNEYGSRLFADFFFFITGFHGFHVFSGVMINLIIFFNVVIGTYERRGHYEMVEKVGLYWHFVDLVWVFVFTFFYLV
jgi:cytochrome c oxidase subunit 3